MNAAQKKKWNILVACMLALPFLYLLAAGPFVYLEGRGAMSREALEMSGYPIKFAAQHGVFQKLGIDHALVAYFQWWLDKGQTAKKRAEEKRAARAGNGLAPNPNK